MRDTDRVISHTPGPNPEKAADSNLVSRGVVALLVNVRPSAIDRKRGGEIALG